MQKITILMIIFTFSFTNTIAQNDNNLIWEENFEGGRLNPEFWNYDLGDGCPDVCGWGNNELQVYREQNVKVKNGQLHIIAEKEDDIYFSGRIHTKEKIEFQYGTVEVRAKVPGGEGLWPAIWMLGHDIQEVGWPDAGEIDIMEYVGRQPDTLYNALHTPVSFGNTINAEATHVEGLSEDFHVFKLEWSKDALVFFIDDEETYRFAPEIRDENIWPFDHPFFLLLNLAVGGNFGGAEIDDEALPQEFIIDYIKVYGENDAIGI